MSVHVSLGFRGFLLVVIGICGSLLGLGFRV